MITPRPYQTEALNAILRERENGVFRQAVSLPTGCHAKGTKILMFDGSLKNVENVIVGDIIMGPNSEGREVLSLASGTDEMFQITPIKGDAFVVNGDHVLSLKRTTQRSDGSGRASPSQIGGIVENITVRDYIKKSNCYKHIHKLYRTGVDFEARDVPMDPYFLGIMLGDGSTANGSLNVTKPDKNIRDECVKQAAHYGLSLRVVLKKDSITGNATYFFVPAEGRHAAKNKNPLRNALIGLRLNGVRSGEKFIPEAYKVNSREVRLSILAGLLDTDGYMNGSAFEFCSKSETLAEDVVFLSRSLGLAAYITPKAVKDETYYRVSISGDCSVIPTRIPRKKAPVRIQKKDVLVSGFSVTNIGSGEYYGFQISGDNLYLMSDFTVTHNSGKSILFGMLVQKTAARSLILAHREELLTQAVQKMKLVDPGLNIGILRAEDSTGYYTDVCVASVQTATRGKRLDILKNREFGLCVIDEAHHATSESYYRVVDELGFMSGDPGKLLVGVTATAFRSDGVGLNNVFEKIVFERTAMAMIKAGYLCDVRGISVKTGADLSAVHSRGGDFAVNELSDVINVPERNRMIAESYLEHCRGRRAVAFCCDVEHAQDLASAFSDAGVRCAPVWGEMDRQERARTLMEYAGGNIQVLTNCAVLTEGWDDPATSAVLLARPTKSRVLYTQMIGRGLRTYPGKADCLVVDYADTAGRHNLCGLATLSGDPRIKPKPKQTLLEAYEEFEETGKDAEEWKRRHIGDVRHEEFELFGRSDFMWTPVQGGHFRIAVSPEQSLWVRREPGGYMVWLLNRRDFSDKTAISSEPLPLGYAQGEAEDYIRLHAARTLVSKDAAWRRKPATIKQLETLAKLRIPHDPNGVTSGDASILIDLELARREASRQEPASSKQIWYIRHKLGLEANDGITKGEASRLISEAKERRDVA